MRTCRSCGSENPDDSDFCRCGEYLRWEPTSYVPAVAAPRDDAVAPGAATAKDEVGVAEDLDPNITLAGEATAAPRGGRGDWQGGAGHSPPTPGHDGAPPGAAALSLRLPDDDGADQGAVSVSVAPGSRATIVGLIRNQSDVVDNFDLSIRGVPDGWWTITPATVYLVPYGSAGTYEQEVQIQLHPPRSPQAYARPWSFEVVAASRAYGGEAASAPATMTIAPYAHVVSELRPERASGRLKARYVLTVHNQANARAEVDLAAEDTDAECRFRFAQPRIALEPGNGLECPFTVFPPSQNWIGKPKDRQFQVTAAPLEAESPPAPRMATFRQKSWLPRWMAVAAAVIVALVAVALKLAPKHLVVPNVKGQPSVWAAEKALAKHGFVMAPKPAVVPDAKKPAGSIADQIPAAGAKAKRGAIIKVTVYGGAGGSAKVTVPQIVGNVAELGIQTLTASGLTAGTVSPQPPDPTAKIRSIYPFAGEKVAKGTPINIFLTPAAGAAQGAGKGKGKGTAAAGAAAGATAAAVTAGATAGTAAAAANGQATPAALKAATAQAGLGSIAIPKLPLDPGTASAQLSQLGLVPQPLKQASTLPAGQVIGSTPAAGAKVAKGATVVVLIASTSPELAYNTPSSVAVISSTTFKPVVQVPAGTGVQVEPSWSIDGQHLVYSQNGALVLFEPAVKGATPRPVTQPGSGVLDEDPAFAPTSSAIVIAFIQRAGTTSKLCFVSFTTDASGLSCTPPSSWELGDQIAWAPNGRTILVFGSRNNGAHFGLIAFNSSVANSAQATNWGTGTLETNASVAGQGVFAAAFSPNGKKMALAAGSIASGFNLYVVPVGDYAPTAAQQLPVEACQVSWRADSQALAVMQPNGACGPSAFGTIAQITLASPRSPTILATNAAHPQWQPVPTGG